MLNKPHYSSENQGGCNTLTRSFYHKAARFIPAEARSILNLGCGLRFPLENHLLNTRPELKITSVDLFDPPENLLPNIRYIQASVEEPIETGATYDAVCFFELIEHIDRTDQLLRNCKTHLVPDGRLICSVPNLASLYGRIELMLGYQPHVLEISNENGALGSGIFGRLNQGRPIFAKNQAAAAEPNSVHHLRGITYRGMKELLLHHDFQPIRTLGHCDSLPLLRFFSTLCPVVLFCVARKTKIQ